ncbi:hypothetical protein K3495_g2370 [Podosphaera aphanis]|nr:hypothetical protein K3495_g2370 [Podosphaera aphanis]
MKLASPPVLHPLDQSKPVVIDTDSSKIATDGALLQPDYRATLSLPNIHTARLFPVAYTSRKPMPTQQCYSSQERSEIFIRTDHQSLASIRTQKNLPSRMQRFVNVLEHFYPKLICRPGKGDVLADKLSRPPDTSIMATTNISRSDTDNSSKKLPNLNNPSWIDSQPIAEHLSRNSSLPKNLPTK